MDNTIKSLSTLGLCYGRGGLDRGLARGITALRNPHGFKEAEEWDRYCRTVLKHAALLEIESFAAWNLVTQMENGLLDPCPVWTDLKTFDWQAFYRKVHIITGGYPCQPFSQAGLQAGTDDPRHLFPHIELGIDAVRPVLCFFENVANHLNIGFEEVRYRLSRLGYKVEADIFAAEQVGAPHLRKRLFILAVADTYCSEQSKRRGDLAEVLGLQEGQRQPEHSPTLPAGDRQPVGDSNGQRSQGRDSFQKPTMSSKSGEGELGNSAQSDKQRYRPDEGRHEQDRRPGEDVDNTAGRSDQQEDQVRARRDRVASTGQELAHDNGPRSKTGISGPNSRQERNTRISHHSSKKYWEDTVRSIIERSIWPAAQGPNQYEWEEPRLESSLGFTAHGYNFTTDLLRMEGNAVVEQQAELAFRTLITKFL